MRVFVGEDGPADRAGEYRDDDYHENERCMKEVDVKVRYRRKKTECDEVAQT